MAAEPLVVQAIFPFKGSNNDELCLKKGDLITVTQKDEGWWEGTLNGKTGWFPSNYVKECKDAPKPSSVTQNQYKSVVLKDLIDSERAHVTELEGLVTNFLQPLEKTSILTPDEYKQLTGNILEVLETHQQLLSLIEAEEAKPALDQRVGRLFITWASKIKSVHQAYCSLHPRAVCILDKYKDELTKYMEFRGAASPGVLVLTTLLSKPFRRLDKYSGMLQELERHVEESHPDRGDTQRSVSVYKEIATTCSATRRQKELELQVLTGPVRGWEGPSLAALGDIVYMGSVAVGPQHHDRYFVLFPGTLLILSVSHRLSAFIYEGKLPLSGLVVTRLEDSDQYKNAFEISAPMIEKRTAVCQSKSEANHWVELLRKHMPRSSSASSVGQKVASPTSPQQYPPQPPPHLDQRGYCNRASVLTYQNPNLQIMHHHYSPTLPPSNYPSAAPFAALTKHLSRLIKDRTITSKLLKQLLYPEYLNKMNLNLVRIRHHRTELTIIPKTARCRRSVINCDSRSSSEESESSKRIKRQNAIFDRDSGSDDSDDDSDGSSSGSSNPFGYIRYYNPESGKETNIPVVDEGGGDSSTTRYESVVDYGDVGRVQMIVEDDSSAKKHSVVITSVASVNLLTKQMSENSEASSCLTPKPYMACENLVELDDDLALGKNTLNVPERYVPMERQSCPTKLTSPAVAAAAAASATTPGGGAGGAVRTTCSPAPLPPPHGNAAAAATAVPATVSASASAAHISIGSVASSHVSMSNSLNSNNNNNNRGWSATCLRPSPPLRPCLALGAAPGGPCGRHHTGRKPVTYREDGLILDVIEAYCCSVRPRNTTNSVDVTSNGPSHHNSNSGKSDLSKNNTNNNVAEVVQVLQSKINILEYNVSAVSAELSEEKTMRYALQNIVKNYLVANCKDFDGIEWPPMESNI